MTAPEDLLHWEDQLRSFTDQDVICTSSSKDFVHAVQLLKDTEREAFPFSVLLQPFPEIIGFLTLIIF